MSKTERERERNFCVSLAESLSDKINVIFDVEDVTQWLFISLIFVEQPKRSGCNQIKSMIPVIKKIRANTVSLLKTHPQVQAI